MRYILTKISLFGFMIPLIGCNSKPETVNPVDTFPQPYSSSSIWNRQIPANAEFVDVQDAIWGDSAQAPTSIYPDLVRSIAAINQFSPYRRMESSGTIKSQRRNTISAQAIARCRY